jgi:type VI secretion system protein ImpA
MILSRNPPALIEEQAGIVDDRLLAAIPGMPHAGRDVRYDGDYDAIGEARRQDNATLPQGVWLHEVKRADWAAVQKLCVETLVARSKDLQVACWLMEAWINLEGFAGIARGFALLGQLCERFWPDLYPAIEDGDLSARVAPLEWLNEKLPQLLRSLPIVRSATDPEERFSWTDYMNAQRLETVRQRDLGSAERAEAAGAVTLARFGACRQRTDVALLKSTQSLLKEALGELGTLNALLQKYCGKDAPGLGGIRATVEDMLAFLAVDLADRRKPTSLGAVLRRRPPALAVADPSRANPPVANPGASTAPGPGLAQAPRTRQEAYEQLMEIADFLLRTEPHSPTPYLIKRAASWGEMPLPALVQQLSQSGSDVATLLDALGLLQPFATEEIEQDENQR